MRYLPHTDADRADMLARIGVADIDALFRDVPESARLDGPIAELPPHQSEMAVTGHMRALAESNLTADDAPFFCGAGVYRHHIPAAVDHLIQRGEFLTAYTPYQPEVSQGTLQTLFEFQTQVALLTGMEIANASLYDGSTATAEAVAMACRITRRDKALLSGGLHPHYREVVETHAKYMRFDVNACDVDPTAGEDLVAKLDDDTACVVVQNPGFFGHVRDLSPLADAVHAAGALLVVVVTEPVSLGLLPPPGPMGADIVVGEGQGLGVGLNFGGPHLGLFACREKYVRQMPGRICGETVDADGKRGFVLTLSTREQHIRREKATSNICTNSGLCALAFSIHLSLLGDSGLRRLAHLNHERTLALGKAVESCGRVVNDSFFNELTVDLGRPAAPVVEALAERGILGGVPVSRLCPDDDAVKTLLLLTATELTSDNDIDALTGALQEVLS